MATVEVPASAWWVPAVTCRKSCGIGFNERLVWSALLRRIKAGGGSSAESLARQTGLGGYAAGSSCRRLAAERLAICRDGIWHATEPPPDIGFVRDPKVTGGPWWGRFRTWRFGVPAEGGPLTVAQAGVMWMLASLKKTDPDGNQSASCLAKLLGLSRTTTVAALGRLMELGVVSVKRRISSRWSRSEITFSDPLPVGFPVWWAERKADEDSGVVAAPPLSPEEPPAVTAAPAVRSPAGTPKQDATGLPDHVRRNWEEGVRWAGIPTRDQRNILRLVEEIAEANEGLGWPDAEEMVNAAHEAHNPAGARGRRDCGALLIDRLQKRLVRATENRRLYAFSERRPSPTPAPVAITEVAPEEGLRAHDPVPAVPAETTVDPEALKRHLFCPLKEIGLRERLRVRCDACGREWVPEPDHTDEGVWPPEVRETADRIRAVGDTDMLQCGPPQRGCDGCSVAWSGLILRCRRKQDRLAVYGSIAFPGAEPLPLARVLAEEPTAVSFLDRLSDDPLKAVPVGGDYRYEEGS